MSLQNVAQKSISHYRELWEIWGNGFREKNVLLNSFNPSRFDVCSAENSSQRMSFHLHKIFSDVCFKTRTTLWVLCFTVTMLTAVRTGQTQSGRSFSHGQLPKGVSVTGSQTAAWSWTLWLLLATLWSSTCLCLFPGNCAKSFLLLNGLRN